MSLSSQTGHCIAPVSTERADPLAGTSRAFRRVTDMNVARRLLAIAAIAGAVAAVAAHDRVVAVGDVVAASRDTIDIGDHVVAAIEPDTRVTFEVRKRRVFAAENASVQQLSGTAIY